MVPQPTAVVTASGVRDGDPPTLAALAERRGRAVLAYCEEVCGPDQAVAAAADALARFRRSVADANDPLALDPEMALLRATRYAAAAHAPAIGAPAPRHGLLGRRGGPCAIVPELLAAQAAGDLTDGDRGRLARHLERCPACRSAAERFRTAEAAYRSAPDIAPEQPVTAELMRALLTAAPNRPVVNGAPRNGTSHPAAETPVTAAAAAFAAEPAAPDEAAEQDEIGEPEPEPKPEPHERIDAVEAAAAVAGGAPLTAADEAAAHVLAPIEEHDAPVPGEASPVCEADGDTVALAEPAAVPAPALDAAATAAGHATPAVEQPPAIGQPTTLSWEASEVAAAVAAAAAAERGSVITRAVVPGAVLGGALALAVVAGGAFAKDNSIPPVVGPSASLPLSNLHPPAPPVLTPLGGLAVAAKQAQPKKSTAATTTGATTATPSFQSSSPAATTTPVRTPSSTPASSTTTTRSTKTTSQPAATSAPPAGGSAPASNSGYQPTSP